MFARLGRFSYDHHRWVLAGAAVFFLASLLFSRDIVDRLKAGGLEDAGSEAVQAQQLLIDKLPRPGNPDLVLLIDGEGESLFDIDRFIAWYRFSRDVVRSRQTERVTSHFDIGSSGFVTEDRTKAFALVTLVGTETEQRAAYTRELEAQFRSDEFKVLHGGPVPANIELAQTVKSDLLRVELLTLPLSLALLFYVLRGLVASILPLIAGVVAIVGALAVLRVIAALTDISVFATIMISMLALAVSIDYSLFIVSRYREEMARTGDDAREAVVRTLQTAGRAVAVSGVTTALSLASLLFFNQMLFRSLAFGGVAAVLVAVTTALLLLPAMIALLAVNAGREGEPGGLWPGRMLRVTLYRLASAFNRFPREERVVDHGLWQRVAAFGQRWPVPIVLVVLTVLVLFGLPFARIHLELPDDRVLPERFESRVVSQALRNDFPGIDISPVHVVVTFEDGRAMDHYDEIAAYGERLADVAGTEGVDSLTTRVEKDLMERIDQGTLDIPDPQVLESAREGISFFASDDTALIDVALHDDPQSAEAQGVLEELRRVPVIPGTSVLFGGDTALLSDTQASLLRRVPLVAGYIIVVTFVALFLQFGSIVIPLKAIVVNAASLTASFGALVLVFQDGRLQGLLQFEQSGSVATVVPVLIFAIAFGLSIDYEIFLLSRIKEEYDATGDTGLAVARGLQRTGRIITGAALVIVVVFGLFATSEMVLMKQLGLGLALAVLIDATIIRTLLVPAMMHLMGRANWWAPRPLRRVARRVGLAEG